MIFRQLFLFFISEKRKKKKEGKSKGGWGAFIRSRNYYAQRKRQLFFYKNILYIADNIKFLIFSCRKQHQKAIIRIVRDMRREYSLNNSRVQISFSFFFKQRLISFIRLVLISVVITVGIRFFVIEAYTVRGKSMMPTLYDGDKILVFKLPSEIRVNDIIVFFPPGLHGVRYVKRVVGCPGDELRIYKGQVIVNGFPIPQDYVSWENWDSSINLKIKIPPGYYFVLGDNRIHSQDSRYFGLVPAKNIIGVAILVFWPPKDFRIF